MAALGGYNTSWQLPQTSGLIGGARTGLLPPRHATRASWLVRSQDFPRRPQLDLVREWMRRESGGPAAVVAVLEVLSMVYCVQKASGVDMSDKDGDGIPDMT